MTAPERIWIDAWGGNWSPVSGGTQGIEYIRADLAQPAQVRVKPLVWEERDAHFHAAQSQIGVYYLTDYKGMVVPFKLECPSQISSRNYTSIDDAKAAAQVDYEASILAALEPQPDQTVEIDLRVAMMEELEKAASESLWVPEEYYMNEVISDCCAFLRSDRSQPDPRDEVIKGLVEALCEAMIVPEAWYISGFPNISVDAINQTKRAVPLARAALAAAKALKP